jgi:Lhr-like helicase
MAYRELPRKDFDDVVRMLAEASALARASRRLSAP